MDVEEINVYYDSRPDILVDQLLYYLDLTQFKTLKCYIMYDIYMGKIDLEAFENTFVLVYKVTKTKTKTKNQNFICLC